MSDSGEQLGLRRQRTGIPGLDTVLHGGLFTGSSLLVLGSSGTGKTVLGTQLAFHHARRGGRAVYMTLLTETHGRLVAHMASMAYFDAAVVGSGLYVVSGTRELVERGPKGLSLLIRRLVRQHHATLFVLDGLSIVHGAARTGQESQRFMHEVNVLAGMVDCTLVFLANADRSEAGPERAIVDTILYLDDEMIGLRAFRTLRVLKMRGSSHLRGVHPLRIDRRGMRVYPRIESVVSGRHLMPAQDPRKLSTGVPGLDEMLLGGVVAGSSTLLLGAPGSGKTLLGLSFLAAGAEAGEPGLYFGFYESPPRLVAKGEGIGLRLGPLSQDGLLTIEWRLPIEQILDDLVRRMLVRLKRTGATRLFVDGLDAIMMSAAFPERLPAFFTALSNELRGRGISTFFSQEMAVFGADIDLPVAGVSAAVENIVMLRYVEYEAHLRRLLSILKVRESSYDSSLREFKITPRGIEVAPTFESAESIMSGVARASRQPAPPEARRSGGGR